MSKSCLWQPDAVLRDHSCASVVMEVLYGCVFVTNKDFCNKDIQRIYQKVSIIARHENAVRFFAAAGGRRRLWSRKRASSDGLQFRPSYPRSRVRSQQHVY